MLPRIKTSSAPFFAETPPLQPARLGTNSIYISRGSKGAPVTISKFFHKNLVLQHADKGTRISSRIVRGTKNVGLQYLPFRVYLYKYISYATAANKGANSFLFFAGSPLFPRLARVPRHSVFSITGSAFPRVRCKACVAAKIDLPFNRVFCFSFGSSRDSSLLFRLDCGSASVFREKLAAHNIFGIRGWIHE